ncbi:putative RTA1 domain protein [Taphrina deformans PYCC 5710]|uniref:RTA1 domain protein n=1 Tax=Taphrina deformans (strain PYCC 5710 / ATCC 11124 / CBS 356.35 / IMI 108563 / JCM 9778 / NBRC 8474) TaxID=1097556 RepID=R4XDC4_TAPDE|nr:putative RTA1 domain protein [Taphrina deformans PYCC 5710]|eukprot:CCG82408.1 putative RTA1 domain protein [Taphrina deformans PYCC 5710]
MTATRHMSTLVRRINDTNNYIYIPSLAGAVVSFLIFALITGVLAWQLVRYRVRYPTIFVLGAAFEALGYLFRTLSASGDRVMNFTLFILMDMFVILSPLAFMAGLYITYGRLLSRFTTTTGGSGKGFRFSFIPASRYAKLFVACDVTSFLIQAAGAGLIVSKDAGTAATGKWILMAGLAFGLFSFSIFVACVVYASVRVRRAERAGTFVALGLAPNWRWVLLPVSVSALCILARTVYRMVEFADGYHGHIYSTEWYLYVFDTTLMVICIAVWVPFFPAQYGLTQTLRPDDEQLSTRSTEDHVTVVTGEKV